METITISKKEYNDLLEKSKIYDILIDEIEATRKEVEEGKFVTLEQFLKEMDYE